MLTERGIGFTTGFPPRLDAGDRSPSCEVGDEVKHNDFVTRAWSADPLKVGAVAHPGLCAQRRLTASESNARPLRAPGRIR